jgi:hypothetical protein
MASGTVSFADCAKRRAAGRLLPSATSRSADAVTRLASARQSAGGRQTRFGREADVAYG